tara:strand:+ start:147 stop:422 length:276 start_codon:yes stop_codon:yes gene_type:complete
MIITLRKKESGMTKSHNIEISFKYLVTPKGEEDLTEQDLLFRLGYDPAEIPVSDDLFTCFQNEISKVLPSNTRLDRIGGELSLNGLRIKNF